MTANANYGAIEAGGTKFICGVGTGPEDLRIAQFPTKTPDETIAAVTGFFRGVPLEAIGIGSFGPVANGFITNTPKAGWRNTDLAGRIGRELGVPVGFDSDVNAAAIGEAKWGAAQGFARALYLTIGTGIGGGAPMLHGVPEMGHIRIPHDLAADPFPGNCPFHGDCLEGLAAGPAIHARWGRAASELPPDHPAWALEARYLGLALANFIFSFAPDRIILGGGVMHQTQLFPLIRAELSAILNGYAEAPEVMPPALGDRAGVLGALALGMDAAGTTGGATVGTSRVP